MFKNIEIGNTLFKYYTLFNTFFSTLANIALSFMTYSYVVRTTLNFPVLIWFARDLRQFGEPCKRQNKIFSFNLQNANIQSMYDGEECNANIEIYRQLMWSDVMLVVKCQETNCMHVFHNQNDYKQTCIHSFLQILPYNIWK